MTKICFCGISGNGMSPLAQIMSLKGCEVYGSDRNFDAGRDGKNRQALLNMNIKLVSQDGSGITADTETVYVSAALDENNRSNSVPTFWPKFFTVTPSASPSAAPRAKPLPPP